jgi:hypothetical protein
MVAKEIAALVERHWMRKYPAQRVQFDSGRSDDVMNDAQQKLALHKHITRYQ